MERSLVYAAAPNLVSLCVDEIHPFRGWLHNRYSEKPVEIRTECDIIRSIDRLCDELGFPERALEPRTFSPRRHGRPMVRRGVKIVMSTPELIKKNGEKGTFLVHVQYRQNASWQGQVTWVEKQKTLCFRSALELLKMIDGALDSEKQEDKGDDNIEKSS